MPKNSISDYDSTAANNTDVGGVDIDENCAPSGLNDAIREVMSHLKDGGFDTITVNGGQITFPATQSASADANTLDDYEEGTFTPELWDSGLTDESATYDVQLGWYTKVGNLVHFSGQLNMSAITGLTTGDGMRIGPLPFTASSDTNYTASVSVGFCTHTALTAGYNVKALIRANTNYINVYIDDTTTGTTSMTIGEFGAAGVIEFGGSYRV